MVVKSSNMEILTKTGWQRHGGGTPPPPPPPTGEPMLLGANITAISSYSTWTNREATVGNMGIRRSYDPNQTWLNQTFANTPAGPTVGKGMTNWFSFVPDLTAMGAGSLDTQLTNFAASIGSNEYVMLTIKHEPEDANPTTWKNAHKRAYSVIKANVASPSKVLVGPCFQGYTFTPGSGRLWNSDWLLPVGYADFVGFDYYQPYHYPLNDKVNHIGATTWSTLNTTMFNNVKTMCTELGVPGAIGELGCSEDTTLTYKNVYANPQHKIDWVQDVIDWGHSENWLAISYFDSYKPNDTDPSIVLDSTTQFKNYWKAQCVAHPATTF